MENQADTTQNQGMPEKLVNWANAPKLSDLKADLVEAKPIHDAKTGKITQWLKNLEEGGTAPAGTPGNASKIAPKLIRKQAEWRYPALSEPFLSTPDVFNVSPVTWEDRKAAQQNQLVLNHQFNTQIDKVRFIDEYVRTAVDEGTVLVRVGWEFEEVEVEETVADARYVIDPNFGSTIEFLEQLKQQDPVRYKFEVPDELKQAHLLSQEHGAPVRPDVQKFTKERGFKTVKNRPTVEICDYRNVVVDPTCHGNLRKAQFISFSFESSISELSKDSKYKNLNFVNPSNHSVLATPDHGSSKDSGAENFNFKDKARQKFVVQEYWGFWDIDGSGKTVPFVAAWVGDVLIRMEESPFPDKELPFVLVQYLPKRKSTHGEPDGALLEDNQKVMGAVTRGMIDLLGKSANGQTGMRKDMLDTTNRRKFEAGQDYEFNANVDPRVGVHMHTYPEIPQSAQFMLQMVNMDSESLTGVKSFAGGVSGQSLGDVAAGVRGALDAASKRELGILRRLAEGIVQIGRKFIAMNAEFLSEEEVIRITNEDFVLVRRDDLAGNFDLKLSISTAEEDDNKARELAFMLQTIGNDMDPGMSKMILSDIARLRKMPDLAKRIESYQPQPDPVQQQMQQLQLQLLQAQVQETMAKAMKLQADSQLAGAKVGTEAAKAGDLQSAADLKNLQFVEQESGVTQARDLQLHGEQARSQAQLKVLDMGARREEKQMDLVKEYMKARMMKKAA
jgi:hypothetical protein